MFTYEDTRFVVNIDIPETDPKQAYRRLYEVMSASGLGWESTDEWFAADSDGEPSSVSDLNAIRLDTVPMEPPSSAPELIEAFFRHCEEAEHTDTGAAWSLLETIYAQLTGHGLEATK